MWWNNLIVCIFIAWNLRPLRIFGLKSIEDCDENEDICVAEAELKVPASGEQQATLPAPLFSATDW